jgi:pyridoxal phosphate enzyme (YggS family)
MRPIEQILELYNAGQRAFGENRPLEMKEKYEKLPKDIEWHFIGHLQNNKIKYIAPYVSLIHSIDRFSLLREVNTFAAKNNRIIPCLLQFFIAQEKTKTGFLWNECVEMLETPVYKTLDNIKLIGVMGMATFTENQTLIREEFRRLYNYFLSLKEKYFFDQPDFKEVSMGMSDDYPIAIAENSSIVRIGSAVFGL